MWDPPGSSIKVVSPALAGWFLLPWVTRKPLLCPVASQRTQEGPFALIGPHAQLVGAETTRARVGDCGRLVQFRTQSEQRQSWAWWASSRSPLPALEHPCPVAVTRHALKAPPTPAGLVSARRTRQTSLMLQTDRHPCPRPLGPAEPLEVLVRLQISVVSSLPVV